MATSGELIAATAQATGLAPVTVGTYYKALREAGLTSKSGRGPSAAKMTVTDAANLLIGLAASPQAKDVGTVVPHYRQLENRAAQAEASSFLNMPGDLGQAVEQIITAEIEGGMSNRLRSVPQALFTSLQDGEAVGSVGGDEKEETIYTIRVDRNLETAGVDLIRVFADREEDLSIPFGEEDGREMEDPPGMLVTVSLTRYAVLKVADLLRGGPLEVEVA